MYRKFRADHFFDGYKIWDESPVLVTDQEGSIEAILTVPEAGEDVMPLAGLLTPGFINAHCHLELSHMRGTIPEATGLVQFVQQVMSSRASPDEFKLNAMKAAAAEMRAAGIVAVGDICNTPDSIPVKQESDLHWHNFVEVSGFMDATAEQRFSAAQQVLLQFQQALSDQATGLVPHAPYSVSKSLFSLLNNTSPEGLMTIHNQESTAENELYQYGTGGFLNLYCNFGIDYSSFQPTGKSSFQSWLPYFDRNQSIIAVHNTYTDLEDLDFLQQHSAGRRSNLFYCICINANKYIEQKIPPVELLHQYNHQLVLGTDSYASNHQLSILEEIKTLQQETKLTLPELLPWATINGARVLRMDQLLGSFEKGKRPGIVLIDQLQELRTTGHSTAKRIL